MEKLKCKVVMLATEKSNLFQQTRDIWGSPTVCKLSYSDNQTYIDNIYLVNSGRAATNAQDKYNFYHLYFISDEKIQIGDYYTIYDSMSIHKAGGMNQQWYNEMCKKVVASTDSSLSLPMIPESFVKEYIETNGEINEVFIETINIDNKIIPVQEYSTNTIIISKPKQSWTKDEVVELLIEAVAETADYIEFNNPECAITFINTLRERFLNNWIEENL